MRFASIAAFTAFLRVREAAVMEARHKGLEAAGKLFERTSKDMIGQENDRWADLAPSTIEEKQRLGFVDQVSATDPLLRTGELRASIKATVEGNKVTLASDDPVAGFQEFGTSRIPPRPFIGAAVYVETQPAAEIIADYELGAAMGLRGPLRPISAHDGDAG